MISRRRRNRITVKVQKRPPRPGMPAQDFNNKESTVENKEENRKPRTEIDEYR